MVTVADSSFSRLYKTGQRAPLTVSRLGPLSGGKERFFWEEAGPGNFLFLAVLFLRVLGNHVSPQVYPGKHGQRFQNSMAAA